MDDYVELCRSLGLPVWMSSLIVSASRLKNDVARRRKVYRLLHRKLMLHGVGVGVGSQQRPTYVYPDQVKRLIRSIFPQDVCDYPDPDPAHHQVVYVSTEDLHRLR